MNTPNAILFDLDGTLADTASDLSRALNLLLEQEQRSPLPLAKIRPAIGQGAAHLIQAAYDGKLDERELERLVQAFLPIYAEHLHDTTCLFPQAAQTIEALEKRGLRWGIVTNKSERFALPIVQRLGLYEQAGCLVCGDTTEAKKPSPIPLLYAASRLDTKPSACVYIGDHSNDVQAAKQAGMISLTVSYGYHSAHTDLEQWGSDAILNRLSDLIDWLDYT